MKIFIERQDKTINKKFEGSASTLLKELKINPQTVVIVRNNAVVTEKETLKNSDTVRLLSVVSGG
jgi:sulfur carrier protein ThiS